MCCGIYCGKNTGICHVDVDNQRNSERVRIEKGICVMRGWQISLLFLICKEFLFQEADVDLSVEDCSGRACHVDEILLAIPEDLQISAEKLHSYRLAVVHVTI